ncbi:Uncharacterised protein [Mycobacteroides abscessus subsp. abscessus]|nr:Uncharacterised protein [Mycobacteroides abscessus subsp. abscessus]
MTPPEAGVSANWTFVESVQWVPLRLRTTTPITMRARAKIFAGVRGWWRNRVPMATMRAVPRPAQMA